MTEELDRWLSSQIREEIEQRFYAEVNRQASLEMLRNDPTFLEAVRDRKPHVGLISDHGIVHVRDIAQQVVTLLRHLHGRLIPRRPPWRLTSMLGYGVLLANFHDIGMSDFSPFGRIMHPEFTCHAVYTSQMDQLIEAIWRENSANLAWRVSQLEQDGVLDQDPRVVLRELLALAMGHSKSKVPMDILNDRSRLQCLMAETVSTDLGYMNLRQKVANGERRLSKAKELPGAAAADSWIDALEKDRRDLEEWPEDKRGNPQIHRYYQSARGAFSWLTAEHHALRELAEDAVDVVRVLRCADSLRQRGHLLKTSGEYEIFVSRHTGTALISFQSIDNHQYLFELDNPISAGEANIASSEIDADCNLRISFYRGEFSTTLATEFAIHAAAKVVEDIQEDAISSFIRPAAEVAANGLKPTDDMQILLEETGDTGEFVSRVRDRISEMNPSLRGRIQLVTSLRDASEMERNLYLAATPVPWDTAEREDFIRRLEGAGHRIDGINPETAFQDVRLVHLRPGEILLEAGAPAAFVYVPLGTGLRIFPLGGYEVGLARPWTPIGTTGVIRGATRKATIVAEAQLTLLMIPRGIYLREWHRTHTPESFLQAIVKN